MSLLTFREVRPWAKAIRKSVNERSMPPFSVNAPLGHFKNDNRLTESEVETILSWVDEGAPRGNSEDAPPPLEWTRKEWNRDRDPDLIIEFPAYTTKANNVDEEVLLFGNTMFGNSVWVEAFEFKPNDFALVHHAGIVAYGDDFYTPEDLIIDSEDERVDKFGGSSNGGLHILGQNHMYTWLPGQRVMESAEGEAFRIKKGERFVIQTHIPPSIDERTLKIQMGVWLANGRFDSLASHRVTMMTDLNIPPGVSSHVQRRKLDPSGEAMVTGFNVHMHLRGKSSQVIFHYPNGESETVFDVSPYDFDWQHVFYLKEPIPFPEGTRIEFVAEWDNSAGNELNPDPTAEVFWGEKTTDEMYTGVVYVSVPRNNPVTLVNGVVARNSKSAR